jgi:hypothetical protein
MTLRKGTEHRTQYNKTPSLSSSLGESLCPEWDHPAELPSTRSIGPKDQIEAMLGPRTIVAHVATLEATLASDGAVTMTPYRPQIGYR